MKRILLLLIALIMVFGTVSAYAKAADQIPEKSEDFWVLDDANVLTDATRGEIFFNGQRMFDACQTDVVVVTVSTTGDYDISDFCNTLYNKWEISANGVLVVMAIGDDDYYTLPGTEMGLKLDSATIHDLQEKYLEPAFAKHDYDAAAKTYYEKLYAKVATLMGVKLNVKDGIADYEAYAAENGVYEEGAAVSDPVQQNDKPVDNGRSGSATQGSPIQNTRGGGDSMGFGLIIVVVLVIVLIAVISSRRRRARRNYYYDPVSTVSTPVTRDSSFSRGFLLGNLFGRSNRRPPAGGYGPNVAPPPPPSSGYGNRAPSGGSFRSDRSFGSSSHSDRSFGGSSRTSSGFGGSSRTSSGFGGSSRSSSSFGGGSRSSFRSSSGFGGASRSGGSRSTGSRGGGAGRSAKR